MIDQPRKRRSQLDKAVVGDLILGFDLSRRLLPNRIVAIEQVTEEKTGAAIVARWKEQGVATKIEVWEARPGFYRRSNR